MAYLNSDIVDLIMTSLADYETLKSTILTCKSFHAVFQAHQNSILTSVAYNLAGPTLPHALSVLRYSADLPATFLGEACSSYNIVGSPPISLPEMPDLERNAAVVHRLEDLYSVRHKDRTSKSSRLSPVESLRFRRAMYRLTLLSRHFPAGCLDLDGPHRIHLDEVRLQRRWYKQQTFLDHFPDRELFEINNIAFFLIDIAKWSVRVDQGFVADIGHIGLAAGPAKILRAYEHGSSEDIADEIPFSVGRARTSAIGYLRVPLEHIWKVRRIQTSTLKADSWQFILDDVRGEKDKCQRCGKVAGFDLWNESNWDYLRGARYNAMNTFWRFFPFEEREEWLDEAMLLHSELLTRSGAYSTFVKQLFDLKTPEFDSWKREDWICSNCFLAFLIAHFPLWYKHQTMARASRHEDRDDPLT